jgi:hypothetical protein
VAEYSARRNLIQTWIIADVVSARQIGIQGRVEIEFALLNQLQNGICEHRFTERGCLEYRIVTDWFLCFGIFYAKAARPGELAISDDRDGETGNFPIGHQVWNVSFKASNLLTVHSGEKRLRFLPSCCPCCAKEVVNEDPNKSSMAKTAIPRLGFASDSSWAVRFI